ncbi:hypothetical protein E3U43_007130 [Larimichthys crocea]|uniref:Uncharacterized protein n=1 Tax=Larimichthys crocea TaxID=215358 RepID=A0ACD3RMN3_LARCR|nr:hypothetical protein E3U43_007130 [Larimichthys crocea]
MLSSQAPFLTTRKPAGPQRSQWKKSLYCRRSLNKNHTKTPHSPPSGTSSSSSFSSSSAECEEAHTQQCEWNSAVVEDSDWLRRTVRRQEKAGLMKNMDTFVFYWFISPRRSRRLVSISMETRGGAGQRGDTSCDLYTLPPVHGTTEFSFPPPSRSSVFLF